jgi:alpha,alpha-trehalase
MYRHRRLDEARANARAEGFRGAMYPWQSGSNGREESQYLHLNPASGRWVPDDTRLQRHINAAVAYNIWQYCQVSHDLEFHRGCGAEMFLEIARFWASIATYNAALDRFEICGVVGPDEFHTTVPGRDRPGLDNNAYTNVMAVWVLWRALDLLARLPEERRTALRERLDLSDEELAHWDQVSRRMRVVFLDNGVISQFEGYGKLDEIDWERYRRRYDDLHRLDRLLEAEGDTVNRYKVSKQPDVLMLFYLFSSEELDELFGRLDYPFGRETIPRTVEYYARRTCHGSTLSRIVLAWVLARADRPRAWRLFNEALDSDVTDIQGGTTPEGIHLGAMAGTLDLIQRGFTGIVTRSDVLWLNPCLPDDLKRLAMTIQYRGHILDLRLTHRQIEIHAHRSNATPLAIGVSGVTCEVEAGDTQTFDVRAAAPQTDRTGSRECPPSGGP